MSEETGILASLVGACCVRSEVAWMQESSENHMNLSLIQFGAYQFVHSWWSLGSGKKREIPGFLIVLGALWTPFFNREAHANIEPNKCLAKSRVFWSSMGKDYLGKWVHSAREILVAELY